MLKRLHSLLTALQKPLLVGAFLLPLLLRAQTPTDGLMMQQRELCTVLQYNDSRWDHYWEGERFRSNSNLGVVSNQSVMLMSAYGITKRLNGMVGLPWVRTNTTASYLQGQRGIQDLSLWLKWQAWSLKAGKGELKLFATGGLSTPLTDYVADFMPLSIGLQSRTASLRAIAHYTLPKGWYATLQAGHTWRGEVEIDREAYLYNNELYYTNIVPVPNWFDATLRIGILRTKFQAEIWGDRSTGLSGDDIRYNEAPFLTNQMQMWTAGIWGKYWFTPQLALSAGGSYVLDGRNVGQSTAWNTGIFYLIQFGKK